MQERIGSMAPSWAKSAVEFLKSLQDESTGLARSQTNSPVTLYGTCYANLALKYLGVDVQLTDELEKFLLVTQDEHTGLMVGPELEGFVAAPGVMHDREHLIMHLTCAALPFCQDHSIILPRPIFAAHRYLDPNFMSQWMKQIDWKRAWFEGNNILFIGQLLVYLRDVEKYPGAEAALELWFGWLDGEVDPVTGLWGTNGYCSHAEAVYGGYHQLLVYWHENRPVTNPEGLVDTVLGLNHPDGGFNPNGNAGACEDVDSVDILVNCYKRYDYRRADIRCALRRCVDHILGTQNSDGGFPYNRNLPQSHMGIPGTDAGPNVSCTFPTWFRIHTLALCHEIVPEHPQLDGVPFRYSKYLSMGWHSSPASWRLDIPDAQLKDELDIERKFLKQRRRSKMRKRLQYVRSLPTRAKNRVRSTAGVIKRRLMSSKTS